jgi:formylmethanofuran dehydrogenase subunit B
MSDPEPPSDLQTMQSSPTTPGDTAKGSTVMTDVVCPYCADLCDDLRLTVERNHITAVEVECPAGRAFFKGYQVETVKPRVRGAESGWDAAVEEAATILARARSPLVLGLSATTCEAQRVAVELAEAIGACVDTPYVDFYGPRALALQQVGEASCTLGEIKNRADLVVVWGADPMVTHPRHLSRYALDPSGLFVPNGRQDRKLIVVDNHRTLTAEAADLFLEVAVDQEYEVLGVLRARLRKRPLTVEQVGGRPLKEWEALLERMKGCRYGVIFYGTGLTMSRGGVESVAQLLHLVNDLNAYTRFSVMAMRGPLGFGNVGGSYKVLCWQSGYPFAVSFARGYPRYNPGEFSASEMLARQEVDAALVVGADPLEYLSPETAAILKRLPTVVLAPRLNTTAKAATVFFPTATYGVSAPGMMFRVDRIPIRARQVVESPLPTDAEILERLLSKLRTLQR